MNKIYKNNFIFSLMLLATIAPAIVSAQAIVAIGEEFSQQVFCDKVNSVSERMKNDLDGILAKRAQDENVIGSFGIDQIQDNTIKETPIVTSWQTEIVNEKKLLDDKKIGIKTEVDKLISGDHNKTENEILNQFGSKVDSLLSDYETSINAVLVVYNNKALEIEKTRKTLDDNLIIKYRDDSLKLLDSAKAECLAGNATEKLRNNIKDALVIFREELKKKHENTLTEKSDYVKDLQQALDEKNASMITAQKILNDSLENIKKQLIVDLVK